MHHRRSTIPPGTSGEWRLEQFTVAARDSTDERPHWARDASGTYTRLLCDDVLYMTDLYAELYTQRVAIEQAHRRGGEVLVTGLGLGLVADAMLESTAVERVTIVEASDDVIHLVGRHLARTHGDRLRLVHADAFDWTPAPDARFTVGWHDIWPTPQDPLALDEARELEARYAPWCDWQRSWPAEYLAAEMEIAVAPAHAPERRSDDR